MRNEGIKMGNRLKLGRKEMKVENLFLVLILIFGSLFLLIQPVYSVPDEGNHFHSAYAVFHDDYQNEGFVRYWQNEDIGSIEDGSYFQKTFVEKNDYRKNKLAFNFSYKEIQRLPQAIGILIGEMIYPSIGVVFLFGRLMNLILYIVAIYFAIKKAKFGKLLMATIALLPISVQQAASISYDVMFYALIFIAFSLITNLAVMRKKLSLRFYIYSFLVILSFFFTKMSIFLMGLYFITLPTELLGDNFLSRGIEKFWTFCNRHKLLISFSTFFILLFYIWYAFRDYGGVSTGLQVLINTFFRADFNETLDSIVTSGIIGTFGTLTFRLPEWLVIINFLFLFVLAFTEDTEIIIKKRMATASVLIWLLNMMIVAITMYRSWTIDTLKQTDSLVSYGTQGRYYTPFLVCLAPVGIVMRKYLNITISPKLLRKLFVGLTVFNLIFSLCLIVLYNYVDAGGYHLLPTLSERLRDLIK